MRLNSTRSVSSRPCCFCSWPYARRPTVECGSFRWDRARADCEKPITRSGSLDKLLECGGTLRSLVASASYSTCKRQRRPVNMQVQVQMTTLRQLTSSLEVKLDAMEQRWTCDVLVRHIFTLAFLALEPWNLVLPQTNIIASSAALYKRAHDPNPRRTRHGHARLRRTLVDELRKRAVFWTRPSTSQAAEIINPCIRLDGFHC